MPVEVEKVVDLGMGGGELLQGLDIPKLHHCTLSSSKRLVGVFSPVVEPPPADLAIRDTNDLHRRAVRPEPVCHDRLSSTIAFHRPFEKLQRRRAIPPFRRENLEHLALMIHSPPEVVGLAIDPYKHFIKVPAPVRMRTMKIRDAF